MLLTLTGGERAAFSLRERSAPIHSTIHSTIHPFTHYDSLSFIPHQYYPTDLALRFVDSIHAVSGLEWWASIALATVLMRALMFPLFVSQKRNTTRMQLAQPEMLRLKNRYDSIPAHQKTDAAAQTFAAEMRALYAKYDANPLKSLAPMLTTIPVFMSFFFALRRIDEVYPEVKTGGVAWFQDLSATDSTYALPVSVLALALWRF